MSGDRASAQAYINSGNLDATDFSGQTLLHHVAGNGYIDIARDLLAAGASPDFRVTRSNAVGAHYRRDLDGASPFYMAAANGHTGVMELLLDRGIDVNVRTVEGFTPLLIAARNKHPDAVRLLLNKGARIELRDKDGTTPLMFAALNGDAESVDLLLASGADVSATNVANNTALLLAGRHASGELIHRLITVGADVNAVASGGATALYEAAYYGNLFAVKALVDGGADIHHRTDAGKTAAHIAAFADNYDTAHFLVRSGTKPITSTEFVEDIFATALTHDLAAELASEKGDGITAQKYRGIAADYYNQASKQYAAIADAQESEEKAAAFRREITLGVLSALESYGNYQQQRQLAQISALSQAADSGMGLRGYYRALHAAYETLNAHYLAGDNTRAPSLYWHARSAPKSEKIELFRLKAQLCEQSAKEMVLTN